MLSLELQKATDDLCKALRNLDTPMKKIKELQEIWWKEWLESKGKY